VTVIGIRCRGMNSLYGMMTSRRRKSKGVRDGLLLHRPLNPCWRIVMKGAMRLRFVPVAHVATYSSSFNQMKTLYFGSTRESAYKTLRSSAVPAIAK
jgi:hypothetical protein